MKGYPDLAGVAVLFVDDNAEARSLVRAILTQAGAQIISVASGSDALQQLETVKPHVILADLAMPFMTGYELAGLLRERKVAAKVLAISALARLNTQREQEQLFPFDGFIQKPVEPSALNWFIHDALTQADRTASA